MLVMLIVSNMVHVKNLTTILSLSICWVKFISCATLIPNCVNIYSNACSTGSKIAQGLKFKRFQHIL